MCQELPFMLMVDESNDQGDNENVATVYWLEFCAPNQGLLRASFWTVLFAIMLEQKTSLLASQSHFCEPDCSLVPFLQVIYRIAFCF